MPPLLTVRVGECLTAIHCPKYAEQWISQGCHGDPHRVLRGQQPLLPHSSLAHQRAFRLARLVHEEDIINKHGNLTTSQDILIKPGSLLMRRQNLAVFLSTSHQRGA